MLMTLVVKSNAVVYIAKVRILEQITTNFVCALTKKGCCLYSKGKNFRANHNMVLIILYTEELLFI